MIPMRNKTYIVDDSVLKDFFKHDKNVKIFFAFLQRGNIKAKIASNIYASLKKNPKIKENERTIARLNLVLQEYGGDSYDAVSFEEATINLVNLHSNMGRVHYITNHNPTYGTNENTEIIERSTLTVSNSAKVADMIRYFDSGFMEWYDGLELLKIQKMDTASKKSTISSMEKK